MTDTDKPRRGRPRPDDAIERDDSIRMLLRTMGPQTRNAVSDALGISRSLAYLALDRLRKSGEVKRCLQKDGNSVWSLDVDGPCP